MARNAALDLKAETVRDGVVRCLRQVGLVADDDVPEDGLLLVEDLGMDSLDAVDLSFRLEDVCGVSVMDTEVDTVKTVGELVALVEGKLCER